MIETIHTTNAPRAIGPYSQAVKHDGIVYCSGQISLDPETMQLSGKSAEEQTRRVLTHLGEILTAAGSGFSDVIRCTIYLADMEDFDRMNAVYQEYFSESPPARETVAVKALPKGALVEISCIAACQGE